MMKLRLLTIFCVLLTASATHAQRGGPPAPSGNLPGPAARESNREMDAYDRELNLLRNDSKQARERRKNLFPQINEDFQRIQIIHNEMVRMVQSQSSLNYDRLLALTSDMKKRCNRLKTNLALPEPENDGGQTEKTGAANDAQVKESIVKLHDLIVSFVSNPIFKNLGLLDTKVVNEASTNLRVIIQSTESLKKSVETLVKTTGK